MSCILNIKNFIKQIGTKIFVTFSIMQSRIRALISSAINLRSMVEADPPVKNFQSPVWGSSSTSGGLNPQAPTNRTPGAAPRGVGHWDWCPPPQPNKRSGERREFPQRGPGQSLGCQCILAYLKPPEKPIKSSIFRKRPLNRSIRGHGH